MVGEDKLLSNHNGLAFHFCKNLITFVDIDFLCHIISAMSTLELRSSIGKIVENTQDEAILQEYHAILLSLLRVQDRMKEIVAYDEEDTPMTKKQLRQAVSAASKRVETGTVRHDEAKQQAQNW
jgi:hypothetical protein